MCEWGNTTRVRLHKPRARSGSHYALVDNCIAPMVTALNDAGIETIGSCCGHGKITGNIALADDRFLEIYPNRQIWESNCPVKL